MKTSFFSSAGRRVFAILLFGVGTFLWTGSRLFVHEMSAADDARRLLLTREQEVYDSCRLCRVLFSPDDDIATALVGLIDAEQESIQAAQYILSDSAISRALLRAHERGVHIELVTDKFCTRSVVGKAKILAGAGICVFEYEPHDKLKRYFKKDSIMHHKFMIFKRTIDDKSVLVTGSYNCTVAASQDNQENCIFIEDYALIEAFSLQFERLKKRSMKIL